MAVLYYYVVADLKAQLSVTRRSNFSELSVSKVMAAVSASMLPLLFFARASGLVVAALVLSWALAFKSSFLPHSSSQEDLIYAVKLLSLSPSLHLHIYNYFIFS